MKSIPRSVWPILFVIFSVSPIWGAPPLEALPPITSVDHGPRGEFRINGKPFFPILLYDAPTNDETFAELRDFGFNVLACNPNICNELPAKGFYGAIHADKKMENLSGVFLTMGTDSPALHFKKNLLQQVTEANAKVTAVVPNRPLMNAIGYWEDEPAGVFEGKLPSKEKYEELVATIDVSAPYLYPVPYQPVASVGDAISRARVATAGKKPLLPILQLFAWKEKDRYPTPAELRCMAFLSLVEGAHGIGYFSYGHVTGQPKTNIASAQPELWKSIKSLNHEIAEIGPRLVTSEATTTVSLQKETPVVKIKAVRDESGVVAVLVNTTPMRQEVKLVWLSTEAKGRPSFSQYSFEFGPEVAEGILDPFGVAIVRWAK